jgi:hypothetical protein
MSSSLTGIAQTIADELSRAVSAAEAERDAGIDIAVNELTLAKNRRDDALAQAEQLQKEAGEMIARSLKIREDAERTYSEDVTHALAGLEALKAGQPKRRLKGRANGATSAQVLNA